MKSIPNSTKLVESIKTHKDKIENARKEKVGKCVTLLVEMIELAIQKPETFASNIPVDISSICPSYSDCNDVYPELREMFDKEGWSITLTQKTIFIQIKK